MAREYLFRAKRKDNGEWVYGLPKYDDSGAICYFEVVKEWARIYGIIPETICEYTGLKDKNGTKIFEGDILAFVDVNEKTRIVGVVEYGTFNCSCCDGVYGWYVKGGDIRWLEEPNDMLFVIGNKFDNTELLGVQDER